jgi:hypothetical protein
VLTERCVVSAGFSCYDWKANALVVESDDRYNQFRVALKNGFAEDLQILSMTATQSGTVCETYGADWGTPPSLVRRNQDGVFFFQCYHTNGQRVRPRGVLRADFDFEYRLSGKTIGHKGSGEIVLLVENSPFGSVLPPPFGGTPNETVLCGDAGGTWVNFTDGCADLCFPGPGCSLTSGASSCDCSSGCWSGSSCDTDPTEQDTCIQQGGSWETFSDFCADKCFEANCYPAVIDSCNCGGGCWDEADLGCSPTHPNTCAAGGAFGLTLFPDTCANSCNPSASCDPVPTYQCDCSSPNLCWNDATENCEYTDAFCTSNGATKNTFSGACGDACATSQQWCTTDTLSMCDCGPGSCWATSVQCIVGDNPVEACAAAGGTWATFSDTCADLCNPLPPTCTAQTIGSCDCGPLQCYNHVTRACE